jgi:hypothetical protein
MRECLHQLIERLDKVLNNPGKKKLRNINTTKEMFVDKIACVRGSVKFLNSCGFAIENGDLEHLLLTEAREDKLHLTKARKLVMKRATEEANMTQDELLGLTPIVVRAPPAPAAPKYAAPADVEEVNFDDVMNMLAPIAFIAKVKKEKIPKMPTITRPPPVQIDDATIDSDFFKWSNSNLRPGGRLVISELAAVFIKYHNEKGRQLDLSNPYQLTMLDAERSLFRWNAYYAKCEFLDRQYFGIQLFVHKEPPNPPLNKK